MNLSEFDYKLANELIATEPNTKREEARLLVMDRASRNLIDDHFFNLELYLNKGDVLVFNDSKVIPARLDGLSGDRNYEILLVKKLQDGRWECWVRPGKKAKVNQIFKISEKLNCILVERNDDIFIFKFNLEESEFYREIEKVGMMPIPPYILKARKAHHQPEYEKEDIKNYQTIFAKNTGSVAAPTAGLHFNEEILARLNNNGVQTEKVTLHVSLGTFQSVTTEKVEDFEIHSEYFEISKEACDRLNQAKKEGRRIIAVGTTSVRVLESAAKDGLLRPVSGETNIYIYPGYNFKYIDGMITNFHLPKSSLLLLVAALVGKDKILEAYDHAMEKKYKFYSYGDGMLIV